MSKLINNIERRMKLGGLTQKALALRAGLNETAVRDILKGRSKDPQFTTLHGIARVLNCAVEDLFRDPPRARYGMSDPAETAWPSDVGIAPDDTPEGPGILFVEELDLSAATSERTLRDGRRHRVMGSWLLPPDALESFSGNSTDLKIIRVQGDSMAPEFHPGDRVMVNIADLAPSPPGVFLLWDGMGFVLRRCEIRPNTKPVRVTLLAAKTGYSAHEMNLKDAAICGRVVGKWQKV